jgi:hypothetical protein
MKHQQLYRAKVDQFTAVWWRALAEGTLTPLTSLNGRLGFLALIVVLFIAFLAGRSASGAAALTILSCIPLFIVWNAIVAIGQAHEEIRKRGRWNGNSFVFHERQSIFTIQVSSADNNRAITVPLPYAPPRGSLKIEVLVEGNERSRIKSQLIPDFAAARLVPWECAQTSFIAALAVPESRTATLAVECETENQSIVQIFAHSWSPL